MSSRWPLTMALASVEAEIWATTPFVLFGSTAPAENGLVRFEMRSRAATAVNLLHPDEFQPGRIVDRMLSAWNAGPIGRAPIGWDGAMCFAALPEGRRLQEGEMRRLAQIAQEIDARSRSVESEEERERRLTRIDAL